ncbi:MAG: hypothetical protein BWZ07_02332 [Alphaproteobacteria bacterium ADurb.BinA280]|nr:MAG: hypothetical protein BWZ07_02332 [Alphaproteobacteria bacterium ADurb.BinA280]
MGSAITLRNIVGETLHVFTVAVVPLHRHFNGDAILLGAAIEDVLVQNGLRLVHVLDEALDTAGVREVFALAGALVDQLDLDAVIEERELTNALGQNFKMVFNQLERLD